MPGWSVTILYENIKDEHGLLGNLENIQAHENAIARGSDKKDGNGWPKFCYTASHTDTSCHATKFHRSPLTAFLNVSANLLDKDADKKAIPAAAKKALEQAMARPTWATDYADQYPKDVKETIKQGKVTHMRSTFRIGAPLGGVGEDGTPFKDQHDRPEEQAARVATYLKKVEALNAAQNKIWGGEASNFKAMLYSEVLNDLVFEELVREDLSWAGAAAGFVFIYFIFHLRSLFLSVVAITLILLSFPVTAVLTAGVLRVTYMSGLHVLVVFVVLGLAADNIFVVIDTWRQSGTISPHIFQGQGSQYTEEERRLAYTVRRSCRAIAMTASTTAVAFLANAWSPIMPIRSFSLFAGIIVPVNFMLIILAFPPAIIIHDRYLNRCFNKNRDKKGRADSTGADPAAGGDNPTAVPVHVPEEEQYSDLELFCGRKWNSMVFQCRWVIFLLGLAWTVAAVYLAA